MQYGYDTVLVGGGLLSLKPTTKAKAPAPLMESTATSPWLRWPLKLEDIECGFTWIGTGSAGSTCPRHTTHKWIPHRLSTQIWGGNWSGAQQRSDPTTTIGSFFSILVPSFLPSFLSHYCLLFTFPPFPLTSIIRIFLLFAFFLFLFACWDLSSHTCSFYLLP